jgi:mRNA interferase RelE/StbE
LNWRVELEPRARKDLKALGSVERAAVLRYLRDRISGPEHPRRFGKMLVGDLSGLWRYRVGDTRIVVRIEDSVVTVFVVQVGNRREVYR